MKVIVVDDEPLAREYMVSILSEIPDLEILAQCANGREAVRRTQELNPDLLLLDIQMPGMNGFETVHALQSDIIPLVIFATAFDHYAIEAFELHAVDYVLKPFEPDRVKLAVQRAKARLGSRESLGNKARIIDALEALSPNSPAVSLSSGEVHEGLKKLPIPENGEILLVPFEDIDWIDAAGDYMCIHVGTRTHILRCTMKELEQKLDTCSLVRIHRSTLVNLNKVRSISSLPKGECELHLRDDILLKVSRSYRHRLDSLLS